MPNWQALYSQFNFLKKIPTLKTVFLSISWIQIFIFSFVAWSFNNAINILMAKWKKNLKNSTQKKFNVHFIRTDYKKVKKNYSWLRFIKTNDMQNYTKKALFIYLNKIYLTKQFWNMRFFWMAFLCIYTKSPALTNKYLKSKHRMSFINDIRH